MNRIHFIAPTQNVMGINNLNQLVHQNLGSQAYDVVRVIHDNITWLYQLYLNKDQLTQIVKYTYQFDKIIAAISKLDSLQENLLTQKELKEFLSLVQDWKEWEALINSLKAKLAMTDLDRVSGIQVQIESKWQEIKDSLTKLDELIKEQECQCKAIKAIQAWIAVKDVQEFPNKLELHSRAYNAIKASEAVGNDESLNKLRLGMNNG